MYREGEESIAAVARRLGLGPETFRRWVREDEIERGLRDGTTREEHAEIVKLRREVRRLEEEKLIDDRAPVAALDDVVLVAEALHQGVPAERDPVGAPDQARSAGPEEAR